MKTYLVNLDRNPERLEFVREQLGRIDQSFERVSAVDGRLMSRMDILRNCSQLHAFAIHSRFLMRGEIGCALSHLEVYQRMVRANERMALVLEDDVKLADGFLAVMRRAEEFMDVNSPQVLLFSSYHDDVCDQRPRIERSPKRFWCTDAYLITLPAAQAIIRENSPVNTVADNWYRWERMCGLQLFRIYPTTVFQSDIKFKTEIGRKGERSIFLRAYLRVFGFLNPVVDRAMSRWRRRRMKS